jgi:hypothetical protein
MGTNESLRRRAFLARSDVDEFIGYVSDDDDARDSSTLIEDGPGWQSVDDALAWARSRAPEVILRFGVGNASTFSAGEVYFTWDDEDVQLPTWPPSSQDRETTDREAREFFATFGQEETPGRIIVVEPERRPDPS